MTGAAPSPTPDVESVRAPIAALDTTLFDAIPCGTSPWDVRALLSLHHAAASRHADGFAYLEIGSFLGGSLQALIRDPRCASILSIDPRIASVPDTRGVVVYEENTTTHMRELLGTVPGADLSKLTTFEATTAMLDPGSLGAVPAFCFVDGEHTDAAALADGRFCVEAVRGSGVIAFHDRDLTRGGIWQLLRELWPQVTGAVGFGDRVFAFELGGAGMLSDPVVAQAVGSRWHLEMWRSASRWPRSPEPLIAAWRSMPPVDAAIAAARARLGR